MLYYDDVYYMYGTGAFVLSNGRGFGCYVSKDLETWMGPYTVFASEADFPGTKDFWAPECHYYNGSFYLFASYYSEETGHRGSSVFKADTPLGPFEEISDGHITPHTQDSIDATLYVDEAGQPWGFYVDEWTSTSDGYGRISAAKLTEDLSAFEGEPTELFSAKDDPWPDSKITDGPFLFRSETSGNLIMLWSSGMDGYCVGMLKSASGDPLGKWEHIRKLLFSHKNSPTGFEGGHGMLFYTREGELMLAVHSPNGIQGTVREHAVFLPVEEDPSTGALKLK